MVIENGGKQKNTHRKYNKETTRKKLMAWLACKQKNLLPKVNRYMKK